MEKLRLLIKDLLFPGIDLVIRQRGKVLMKYLLPNRRTLDAGCGNGYFCFMAYKHGNEVLGISIDEAQINRCIAFRDCKGYPADKVRFKVLNLYDLDKLNETFDQIICLETLEHILYDEKVLKLFYERLNDNGRLYLGVPNANRPWFFGGKVSQFEDGGHVRWGYTYEQLEEMLSKIGFRIIAEDKYGGGMTRRLVSISRRVHTWFEAIGFRDKKFSILLGVSFFLLFYPLTYFDAFLNEEPMSIFVVAQKESGGVYTTG